MPDIVGRFFDTIAETRDPRAAVVRQVFRVSKSLCTSMVRKVSGSRMPRPPGNIEIDGHGAHRRPGEPVGLPVPAV